jgi:branched-chain amino acid transport system ATP-binding protein
VSAPVLEIRDLSRRFGGLQALAGVSAAVGEGSVLGLIGPNGAGKTTLINLVTGHLAPSGGSVLIDGRDLTGARPWTVAKARVARTFQIIKPFRGMTVRENVSVGAMFGSARTASPRTAAARTDEVLAQVGLTARADATPEELSVAESRRLELARALAIRPRLLLLDELMAGLRHAEIDAVLELLRSLKAEGMAIVAVEHVMRAIMSISDQVFVLHEGRELTHGSPAKVVADPRVVEAYLGERYAKRSREAGRA